MSAHLLGPWLADTGPLLLDFDGPVCNIFGHHPAPEVAERLRTLLHAHRVELTRDVLGQADPLEVLRWTERAGNDELTRAIEDTLRAEELAAARSAIPTPYAREVIVAARQLGKQVAIVSNNSAPAIHAYLGAHRLGGHIAFVTGRAYAQPERMKPNPEPLTATVRALDVKPGVCVLVGDSDTDITVAQRVGMQVIAYANKPAKVAHFADLGADVVVTSMAEIAAALVAAAE